MKVVSARVVLLHSSAQCNACTATYAILLENRPAVGLQFSKGTSMECREQVKRCKLGPALIGLDCSWSAPMHGMRRAPSRRAASSWWRAPLGREIEEKQHSRVLVGLLQLFWSSFFEACSENCFAWLGGVVAALWQLVLVYALQ